MNDDTQLGLMKKQLVLTRIIAIAAICILIVVLVASVMIVTKLTSTVEYIGQAIDSLDIEGLNDAISTLTELFESFSGLGSLFGR